MPYGSPDSVIIINGPVVGGTAGSVLFVGASGELAQDNANFSFNDTTDFLSVGAAVKILNNSAFVASDGPKFYRQSTLGACLQGVTGSTSDFCFFTPGGSRLFENPTGTANIALSGAASGNILIGKNTSSGAFRLQVSGPSIFSDKLFPGTDAAAEQSVCGLYAGNGAPNNANGANGDFYLRGDGTQAGNTVIYHKEAGAWVALVTT